MISKFPKGQLVQSISCRSKKDIDCLFTDHNDILKKLVDATKATPVDAADIPVVAVPKNRLR